MTVAPADVTYAWEEGYQTGEMPWDKGAPSPGLVAFLPQGALRGRVLVPGCGSGHDVAAVATMPGVTEALGVDIAPTAIAMAQARWQGVGNARFLLADYLQPPLDWHGAFNAVVEHTCYCAIPRRRRDDYARATGAVLKPGGLFLAMFYLTPRDNPDPDLGPPFNATQEEVIERFGTFFELVTAHVPEVAYPGREGREWLCLFRRRE